MEIQNQNEEQDNRHRWHRHHHSPAGKVFAGILVVTVGGILMAKQLGVDFPHWLLSWKMLLIAVGLYMGFKHSFRTFGWIFPVIIGGVFLLEDFIPGTEFHSFFWPVMLMIIGLFIIFKPRRSHERWRRWQQERHGRWDCNEGFSSSGDLLDAVAVFGSVKKNIISKDFKGGEVTCVFGGAIINLSQADINQKVTLEVTTVFGGAKIIVPQNWQIQTSEMVTVMGGLDDKRPQQNVSAGSDKILVLKGSAVFGGIEILNY